MDTTPRIYVACLAAYNRGILHGVWIDCDQDAEEIQAEIQAMLQQSPIARAEEWAIHSYEGFAGLTIDEYEDLERVAAVAALIQQHGPAFAAYAQHVDREQATAKGFEENYQGDYASEADFAEELYQETHEIPTFLDGHIDWDSIATDLFISDYFSVDGEGIVHVFRNS